MIILYLLLYCFVILFIKINLLSTIKIIFREHQSIMKIGFTIYFVILSIISVVSSIKIASTSSLFRKKLITFCSIISISCSPVLASIDSTFVDQATYPESVGKINKSNDYEESQTVPSRKIIISAKDLESTSSSDESLETILQLIPSYKYFKIIAKEYSSRSSNYQEGKDNIFAPFQ